MKSLKISLLMGFIFCVLGFMTGCGQTGPLYLPPAKTAQTTQTTQTGK